MCCNRFIGETLVHARSDFQRSLLFLQLLLCTKNKFLATGMLMSLLMKAVLSLNVFWQGISKLFKFKILWTVLYICLAQPFSWKFCFLLQNKLFIPSNSY